MSKAAKILGTTELGGIARRATEPPPRRPIRHDDEDDDDDLDDGVYTAVPAAKGRQPGPGTAAAKRRQEREDTDSDSGRSDHHHHISGRIFRARDSLKPGEGMYNPPKFLDEWKKGTVGTLSGALLDLSEEHMSAADRDKAWWEANGRRGSGISSRPRKAEAFDGEYDDTHGRFTSRHHYTSKVILISYDSSHSLQAAAVPRVRTAIAILRHED
jgi:hypothetical protein